MFFWPGSKTKLLCVEVEGVELLDEGQGLAGGDGHHAAHGVRDGARLKGKDKKYSHYGDSPLSLCPRHRWC